MHKRITSDDNLQKKRKNKSWDRVKPNSSKTKEIKERKKEVMGKKSCRFVIIKSEKLKRAKKRE